MSHFRKPEPAAKAAAEEPCQRPSVEPSAVRVLSFEEMQEFDRRAYSGLREDLLEHPFSEAGCAAFEALCKAEDIWYYVAAKEEFDLQAAILEAAQGGFRKLYAENLS